MLTSTFEEVIEDGVVVGKRLVIRYNNKIVRVFDFPPEEIMDGDGQDAFIADKLASMMS